LTIIFFYLPLKLATRDCALHHSRRETNVWIILPQHTWECDPLRDQAPRAEDENESRATCNHSINYVTVRSHLFLLRTRAWSAQRGSSANSPIPFAPPRSRPPSLLSLCLPARTPSRTFLRSVARKRKENTDGNPRRDGWRAHSRGHRRSHGFLLRINRAPARSLPRRNDKFHPRSLWLNCHNRSVKNPNRVFNDLSHYLPHYPCFS